MELNEVIKQLNSKAEDMARYLVYLYANQENLEIIDLKITKKESSSPTGKSS